MTTGADELPFLGILRLLCEIITSQFLGIYSDSYVRQSYAIAHAA